SQLRIGRLLEMSRRDWESRAGCEPAPPRLSRYSARLSRSHQIHARVVRTAVLAQRLVAVSAWRAFPVRGPARPDWPTWRPQTDDPLPESPREWPAPAGRAARPWRIVPARGRSQPDRAEPWPSADARRPSWPPPPPPSAAQKPGLPCNAWRRWWRPAW